MLFRTVAPLLPDESTGLIITGKLNLSMLRIALSLSANPIAKGVLNPLFFKKSLNLSLLQRVSTEIYGFVGKPNFSATNAAVGAAGSDAYATIPSIFSFSAI